MIQCYQLCNYQYFHHGTLFTYEAVQECHSCKMNFKPVVLSSVREAGVSATGAWTGTLQAYDGAFRELQLGTPSDMCMEVHCSPKVEVSVVAAPYVTNPRVLADSSVWEDERAHCVANRQVSLSERISLAGPAF